MGKFSNTLSRPAPQHASKIVAGAKAKFASRQGQKTGRLLSFVKKSTLQIGGGIIAVAVAAVFIVNIMRPGLNYKPATTERLQAVLKILPINDEAQGLLEAQDSPKLAAFVFGFYLQLAEHIDYTKQSRELFEVLSRTGGALKRRGFGQDAARIDDLANAAKNQSLNGMTLVKVLRSTRKNLQKNWGPKIDNWYIAGAALAQNMIDGYGIAEWHAVEDSSLDAIREEIRKESGDDEKLGAISHMLIKVFGQKSCTLSNNYCDEEKIILRKTFEETGIYRF